MSVLVLYVQFDAMVPLSFCPDAPHVADVNRCYAYRCNFCLEFPLFVLGVCLSVLSDDYV